MPKYDYKSIQRELEAGDIRSFYWFYGQEKMKTRELYSKIKQAVLGSEAGLGWGEEVLDAQVSGGLEGESILQAAMSPTLGSSVKLILVKDAHLVKNQERLATLFSSPKKREDLDFVCVCMSKDLDARKKFSKLLLEGAAVVPCENVDEDDKEMWIHYLAKKRSLSLPDHAVIQLVTLDPWSLDIIDQELEKFSLSEETGADVFLQSSEARTGADIFIQEFFSKNFAGAMRAVGDIAAFPEVSLPLLGLINWNVKQLTLLLSDRIHKTHHLKMNPYLLDKFKKYMSRWTLGDLANLQSALMSLDFTTKQTPLLPLGSWTQLIIKFCHERALPAL